ncbi:hypothetical protein CLV46_0384 [Diaminobutyricimonas aerilata]|uniref:Uncharacterized protein n=1 Tax=Diaminobutyricimonas aerilata TaxID=1162967 RepID=A0A2M9CG82_9MICO|nr:hypothetical protein [Diaminobutyricimonas aerilata]PJJ70855.1 hypothetical protein CLV46_0384 [Diaminobutyricimonas aerilata]
MVDWHPARIAQPSEWELRNGWPVEPIAVIRRLEFGPSREVWFRAVTWAVRGEERRLIGYTRSFERAAAIAWEHHVQSSSRIKHRPDW